MALSTGTKLGPYEIQSPLGAGGMGEVYRARDTRLDRTVAVKILPAHLSANPEAKQRFEREAKAISSLSHPNICALYDIGAQDGVDFLVMEYLEGETLATRLEKGALPLEPLLKYAMQIADALDKAHRRGVVHRDLKPGNIMLTASGVKLLDFGLAKAMNPSPASEVTLSPTSPAASPGVSHPVTAAGTVVGTFQYMSPEQVEGKEVDARSDVFSFGAVLYEMVTGRRAFPGKSQMSVASAVLEKDPEPISALQPLTPPALERAVRRCLEKDREDRWQTARDLAHELKWIGEGPATGAAGTVSRALKAERLLWIASLLAMAVVAGGAGWLWFNRGPAAPAPRVTRFAINLPAGETLGGSWWWYRSIALSADDSQMAYVATQKGVSQIYLRAMNSLTARALPGTEGADTPFFSPDGQWLGFLLNDNKLEKIPIAGGPAVLITSLRGESGRVYGACWAPDDTIYFGADAPHGLLKVSAGGGKPQPATKLDASKQETDHRHPELLPGGKTLLFAVRNATQPSMDEADIAAVSLASGERHMLIKGGTDAHYLSSGHLVFVRAGVLLAVPFDPVKLEVKGDPTPVIENVVENPREGAGQFSVSAGGSLVYIPGGVSFGEHELVFVDKSGKERVLTATKRPYEDFTISPDGRFIATTIEGPVTDTWIHDIARDTETRFTFGVEHRDPAWSADGKRVTYSGYRDGKNVLLSKAIDGSAAEELLVASDNPIYPGFWSPDGKILQYGEINPNTDWDVMILRMDGNRKPQPLLQTPFQEDWMSWSPDGRWIAYTSDESGRAEVYVASFPNLGTKTRISTDGGLHPQWAPSGKELYYRTGASVESLIGRSFAQRTRLMAVEIETAPALKAGKPRALFEGPYFESDHDYAVTPDGKGFIFIRESSSQSNPTEMQVVLNWAAELKK